MGIALALLMIVCSAALAAPDKTVTYEPVEYAQLKIKADDYRGKDVTYVARFLHLGTTFPPHAEQAGIRPDKYIWMYVGDMELPVIMKRSDEMETAVAAIREMAEVRISGEVKRLRIAANAPAQERYYVEAASIEVVGEPPARDAQPGAGRPRNAPPALAPKQPRPRPPVLTP